MGETTTDVWEAMSTARTIRRFTDEPVDDATLARCLQAASWAPSGANAQAWRFVVLRSPELRAVVAKAAKHALDVIEPVYGMTRPADDDNGRRARNNRATYELHDRAGEFTSVLFVQQKFDHGLRAVARWLDLPGDAELPARCAGSGPRCVPDQLGVLRGRSAVPRGCWRTGGLDRRRSRGGGMAAWSSRTGPPKAAERHRVSEPTGTKMRVRLQRDRIRWADASVAYPPVVAVLLDQVVGHPVAPAHARHLR